ncbi:hypothetical protein N7445_007253 [Penicillium cf. griseofulvum]|nr:hypothetical protein N7445_007253 [Penicillium cf. griseofulvum]
MLNSDNEWVQPPNGVKLSDEGVYLATKFMNAKDCGRQYPIDFDQNGHVQATRIPEDPAPLAWAHGDCVDISI